MKKMILICICIAGIIWSMFQIGLADDMDASHEINAQDTTWKPTEEDMAYQDSLLDIIQRTGRAVEECEEIADRCLRKLEAKESK
jgi:hypothetical protein